MPRQLGASLPCFAVNGSHRNSSNRRSSSSSSSFVAAALFRVWGGSPPHDPWSVRSGRGGCQTRAVLCQKNYEYEYGYEYEYEYVCVYGFFHMGS